MTHENLRNNQQLLFNYLTSCIYVNNTRKKGNSIYFELHLKKNAAQVFIDNLSINTRKNIHGQVSPEKLAFILQIPENHEVLLLELEKTFTKVSQYLDYIEISSISSKQAYSRHPDWIFNYSMANA